MSTYSRIRTKPVGNGRSAGARTTTSVTYVAGNQSGSPTVVTSSGTAALAGQKTCTDKVQTTSPLDDHTLTITSREASGGSLNGSYTTPEVRPRTGTQSTTRYDSYGLAYLGNAWSSGNPSFPAVDWAYYDTLAKSKMVVHNPIVDLAAFTYELKDFPRQLRDLGRILQRRVKPSDVPGQFLAYKFGWKPLISDLSTLLNFSLACERRAKIITQAGKSEGARLGGTLAFETVSSAEAPLTVVSTTSPTRRLVVANTVTNMRRVWYSSTMHIKKGSEYDRLVDLAGSVPGSAKSLLGNFGPSLDSIASTIWEITPWSWLIDYLANVGDYLEVYANRVPYEFTNFCLMSHRRIDLSTEVLESFPGLSLTQPSVTLEEKLRFVSTRTPLPTFRPFLGDSQKAILYALTTSTALRKFGG